MPSARLTQLLIAREIGGRQGEAIDSWNFGLALEEQGELARAVELMQVRVHYLHTIGHPEAVQRAAELERLQQQLRGRLRGRGQQSALVTEQGRAQGAATAQSKLR